MSKDDDTLIEIVTTAVGTFGPQGLVAPGTKAMVELEAYSDKWMRPANQKSAAALNKWRAAQEK